MSGNFVCGKNKKRGYTRNTVLDYVFYVLLIIVPLVNFLMFAIGGTLQSIILSFKQYDVYNQSYYFAGFENYLNFIRSFRNDPLLYGSIGNSFKFYLVNLLVVTPAGWLFSYLIYKKFPFHGLIKVVLFLPTIVNGLVFLVIYKALVQDGLVKVYEFFGKSLVMPFRAEETGFTFLLIFHCWITMCGNVLVGTGLMSKIPIELSEALKMDGGTVVHEFFHIVLPAIYSVVVIGYALGVMVILNGSPSTFAFFNVSAPDHTYTIGYYLFVKVMNPQSTNIETIYPYTAAAGIMINYLSLPVVLGIKKIMEKLGPKED